jgi:hypothetical protein
MILEENFANKKYLKTCLTLKTYYPACYSCLNQDGRIFCIEF